MPNIRISLPKIRTAVLLVLLPLSPAVARMGGAGGHSSGGHSSGGHSSGGYGHYSSGGYSSSSIIGEIEIWIAIIVIVIYLLIKLSGADKTGYEEINKEESVPLNDIGFPPGLDERKVTTAFLTMQDAWQHQDLSGVRKWLSDGMYQKLSTQIKMMNVLGQRNNLNDIQVNSVKTVSYVTDSDYEVADVAISFVMSDSFTSNKYPQLNEVYNADEATEYWTFIRKAGTNEEVDLYSDSNCPNCGAMFEAKMGEISRCSNCNTLTNSATFDWVLNEITQADYYSGGVGSNPTCAPTEAMQHDPYFSVQRMEDIASNVFMQIMDVYTGDDVRRLSRFADKTLAEDIASRRQNMDRFQFDRLFLNNVTFSGYKIEGDTVKLQFNLSAVYRRVIANGTLKVLDNDFVTNYFQMELSRKIPVQAPAKETVYSYECNSCGAPFEDTIDDSCSYCDALVVDVHYNWVLTDFTWMKQ